MRFLPFPVIAWCGGTCRCTIDPQLLLCCAVGTTAANSIVGLPRWSPSLVSIVGPTLFVSEMETDGLQRQLSQVGGNLSARCGEVAPRACGSGGSRGIIPRARQQHQRQEGALGRLLHRPVCTLEIDPFLRVRWVLGLTQAATLG